MRVIIILASFAVVGSIWWLFEYKYGEHVSVNSESASVAKIMHEPGVSKYVLEEIEKNSMLNDSGDKAKKYVTKKHEEKYYIISENVNYPTFESRLNEMSKRRPNTQYNPDEIIGVLEKDAAWETLKKTPDTLPISDEDISDGREFISFNPLKIESLMPGDNLKLPISETGEYFEMVVESIYHNDKRTLTWHGHLKGHIDNPVQITQSDKLTLADIQTPEGNYILQANGDVGWVVSSATLLSKGNHDESDAITPNYDENDVVMNHEH